MPPSHFLAALATHTTPTSLPSNIHTLSGRLIYFRRVDDPLLDIRRQTIERLLNIDVALRRDLEERYSELVCQFLALFCRYRTLVFPIALVSDEDLVYSFCGVLFDV